MSRNFALRSTISSTCLDVHFLIYTGLQIHLYVWCKCVSVQQCNNSIGTYAIG